MAKTEYHQKHKRRRRWLLLLLAGPGLGIVAVALFGQLRLVYLKQQLRAEQRETRLDAIKALADEGAPQAAGALREALAKAKDRQLIGWAGYAVMRSQDARGVDVLLEQAKQSKDDQVRAKLIINTARLARVGEYDDLRSWMRQGVESDQPWRRVGSAIGIMLVGEPEGGNFLIDIIITNGSEKTRQIASKWLRRVTIPMSEAVGRPIEKWPDLNADREDWSQIQIFWGQYVDSELLRDILERLEERDPQWYELNRLLHARQHVIDIFS
jgi:hypothetical protein